MSVPADSMSSFRSVCILSGVPLCLSSRNLLILKVRLCGTLLAKEDEEDESNRTRPDCKHVRSKRMLNLYYSGLMFVILLFPWTLVGLMVVGAIWERGKGGSHVRVRP